MSDFFHTAFGIGIEELTWWQMSARAIVVFMAALIIIRIGSQRIFGKHTAFDIILGIIYGSILSRAITGDSPLVPTIITALVMVIMHRVLAAIAYYTKDLGSLFKGRPRMLVKDGEVQEEEMKRCSVTHHDLEEAMRVKGGIDNIDQIKHACLERSGEISIIVKTEDR